MTVQMSSQPLLGKLVEPAPEVLTFIGPDGEDLRTYLVELNRMYSENIVQRNKAAPVVAALSKIYEEVSSRGTNRETMQTLEHYMGMVPGYRVAIESRVPIMAYTERRSLTNQRPALEAISLATGGLIAAAGAAAIFLLYKMVKWLAKVWANKKTGKVAKEAGEAAGKVGEIAEDANADSTLAKINRSSDRGGAADMVRDTFSELVSNFGDLPGGYERDLGQVTKGMGNYVSQAEKLFEGAKDLARDLAQAKDISDKDVGRAVELCRNYAKPISAWPGYVNMLRSYGVGVEMRSLDAVAVQVENVDTATSGMKAKMESMAAKPALKSSSLKKNDMAVISKLLTAINKNLSPDAGFFPVPEDTSKQLESISKAAKELSDLYQQIGKQPRPDNAVQLAKLADLNQLCSIWGKLLTDYTTVVGFLENRIGHFTAACTQFLTVYANASSASSTDKAV